MWNPAIVITAEAAFAAIAATYDVWKSIKAVRERRLYVAPEAAFSLALFAAVGKPADRPQVAWTDVVSGSVPGRSAR